MAFISFDARTEWNIKESKNREWITYWKILPIGKKTWFLQNPIELCWIIICIFNFLSDSGSNSEIDSNVITISYYN